MNLRSIPNWLPFVVASLAALAATPSQASFGGGHAVTCADSINTTANDTYAGQCQGPLLGSFGAGDTAVFGGVTYRWLGATNDTSGVFQADGATPAAFGTLNLSAVQNDSFVLGLQGTQTYSLYLFNGGVSAGALDFDSAGLRAASGLADTTVLRAALFVNAVPEPGTYGLMLAGLGGVAFMVRRRSRTLVRASASSR